MSTNVAQLDGVWDQPVEISNVQPYMQADLKFRSPSLGRRQSDAAPVKLNVLGVEIMWTPDGREFPPMIFAAIERLYEIVALDEGWDSYGGRTLDKAVVEPVLKFLFISHHRGSPCPRLVPLSSGGVGMRWKTDAKEIDLDIFSKEKFEFTIEELVSGEISECIVNTPSDAERILEAAF